MGSQLDMFQTIIEDPILSQIQELKSGQNNLRRSVFVRYDQIQREINELRELVHNSGRNQFS